jgi:hypothetical protein
MLADGYNNVETGEMDFEQELGGERVGLGLCGKPPALRCLKSM